MANQDHRDGVVKGMLFSQMEPPAALEAEFNDWYESEHIPARLALPGFSRAVRYKACAGGPKYLAIYEIDDLAVLESPAYHTVKTRPSERTALMLKSVKGFTRYTCTLAYDTGSRSERGGYLSAAAFAVPGDQGTQFDDWYETEHIPLLMRAADWLRIRRFKVFSRDGGPWTDIALHELGSTQVLDRAERSAQGGPKRDVLACESWFARSGRWLYQVHSVHDGA
jgi:hypothetical protein